MHLKDTRAPASSGRSPVDSPSKPAKPAKPAPAKPDEGQGAFGGDYIAQMQALPMVARLTHVPVLAPRITYEGFSTSEPALYWSLPTSHVVRAESPREEFDLVTPIARHFVERASFRMVVKGCLCRVGFDCQRFSQTLGCMGLGEALRPIPASDGHEVSVDEAMAHVRACVENGLVPTIAWEFDIQMYGGPMDRGVIFCFCDWCCCDLRMAARVGNDRFRRKYQAVPGLTPRTSDACDLCGTCTREDVCCVGAVTISEGDERAHIDERACIRCGRCAEVCPKDAHTFELAAGIDVVTAVWDEVAKVTDIVNDEPLEYKELLF